MILVFGGTTEGRKAVEVLEEGGNTYYYSTKTGEQDITLHHGQRIDGALDAEAMQTFCREHDIRLIVDAAHPFASQLHQTIAQVSESLNVPTIRYERIYPERDLEITWIDDYSQIPRDIHSLLATTGVQSIAKLKPLEAEGIRIYYRILQRESSIALALKQGASSEQLCYYEDPQDIPVEAEAILLKESGLSGGFSEKVEAAKAKGMRIIALKRPQTPAIFTIVNGPYGLRRMVEKLLPEFYSLHSGLTTGTCATAAAIAATIKLLRNETPSEVPVILPNGETIHVPVGYGDDCAYCIKDAGDDPDVTNGLEIGAIAEHTLMMGRRSLIVIEGGIGVGTFTLPGFDYPPGSPAIIGVSGIVKPFSEEAFIDSIRKCMTVAKASGSDRVVINSGGKSERFVKGLYPDLPTQAFVEYGNYIGETLKIAHELDIRNVTLGVMLGKAVKLAAGHLDTHSRRATMDKAFVKQLLDEAHCNVDITSITLARELWDLLSMKEAKAFAKVIISHCTDHCAPLLPNGSLTILLITDEGMVYPNIES